jgi:hypothetical protein
MAKRARRPQPTGVGKQQARRLSRANESQPQIWRKTNMSRIKEYLEEMQEKLDNEALFPFPTEADYCSTTTDTEVENPVNQNEDPIPDSDIAEELPQQSNE